jgi:hypothetical protein
MIEADQPQTKWDFLQPQTKWDFEFSFHNNHEPSLADLTTCMAYNWSAKIKSGLPLSNILYLSSEYLCYSKS